MANRYLFPSSAQGSFFDIPSDMASLEPHYVLATDDLDLISSRRGAKNRLGLAIHIALRVRVGEVVIKSRRKLFTGFLTRYMRRLLAGLSEAKLVYPGTVTLERIGLAGRARARRLAAQGLNDALNVDQQAALRDLLIKDPSLGISRLA